jgi:hypothetical protein
VKWRSRAKHQQSRFAVHYQPSIIAWISIHAPPRGPLACPGRIVYRIDPDAIVIVEVFAKKTGATPKKVIDTCKARLRVYDEIA